MSGHDGNTGAELTDLSLHGASSPAVAGRYEGNMATGAVVSDITLVPAPGLSWCVESDGVVLMRADGRDVALRYPEAAIWDQLTRGIEEARMVRLCGALTGWGADDARAHVRATIQALVASGCLREEKDDG